MPCKESLSIHPKHTLPTQPARSANIKMLLPLPAANVRCGDLFFNYIRGPIDAFHSIFDVLLQFAKAAITTRSRGKRHALVRCGCGTFITARIRFKCASSLTLTAFYFPAHTTCTAGNEVTQQPTRFVDRVCGPCAAGTDWSASERILHRIGSVLLTFSSFNRSLTGKYTNGNNFADCLPCGAGALGESGFTRRCGT